MAARHAGPIRYPIVGLGHIAQVRRQIARRYRLEHLRQRISRPGVKKPFLVKVQSARVD